MSIDLNDLAPELQKTLDEITALGVSEEQYHTTRNLILSGIEGADELSELEAIRLSALGKSGVISVWLKLIGTVPPENRAAVSHRFNRLRNEVQLAITARKAMLEQVALDARLQAERVDITLPVDLPSAGTVHPVSQVMDELAEIFADLGFAVATGPEIEDDWHNFTALNIPETHPARAMHDTFYVERRGGAGERMVLRTHTSPVQVRTMVDIAERTSGAGEPIRIIAPGRVYRSDWDATHTPMFHQIEGLVIDRGVTMGHLKWTLETFLRAFFERDDIVLRLRPSYFPFTEPSAEVDVGWTTQKGRRVLGGDEGWMELLGSGMVHPRVIANCGLDPNEWQGFAFGVGVDRLAMLKYGMDDLRPFFEADGRWLKHYGFSGLDGPTLSGGVGA